MLLNEANGEDNNEGESQNRSWNCGADWRVRIDTAAGPDEVANASVVTAGGSGAGGRAVDGGANEHVVKTLEIVCHTLYALCMTMLSFRVSDDDAVAVELWARRLHMDRSELLREALRRHLSELAAALEVQVYERKPITDDEKALSEIADWGPAEDWADWADAKG